MSKKEIEKGLWSEVVAEGAGDKVVKVGDTIKMHYTGKLEDGTKFDSSVDRNEPLECKIGVGMLIRGWDLAVPGMKVGEKRVLTIDSDLAYGPNGIPGVIPGGATLVFDVELVEII